MPNTRCRCGEFIPLGSIPNEHTMHMISDMDLAEYHGDIPQDELFDSRLRRVVVCPACGRLMVQWENGNPAVTVYAAEL